MSTQIPVSHMAFVRGARRAFGGTRCAPQRPDRTVPCSARLPELSLQHSQCDPQLWLVSGFWSNQQAMTAYFNTPAMEIFAELVQELVVNSLDFHTFKDVSAAQALGQSEVAVHKLAG